jgi:hypothetical protein
MGNLIRLLSLLVVLHSVLAVYEPMQIRRQPYALNNQRSADNNYKYAWFTRDIHDDDDDSAVDAEQDQYPSRTVSKRMLKHAFNRKQIRSLLKTE